jgi:hypothetical protein
MPSPSALASTQGTWRAGLHSFRETGETSLSEIIETRELDGIGRITGTPAGMINIVHLLKRQSSIFKGHADSLAAKR